MSSLKLALYRIELLCVSSFSLTCTRFIRRDGDAKENPYRLSILTGFAI